MQVIMRTTDPDGTTRTKNVNLEDHLSPEEVQAVQDAARKLENDPNNGPSTPNVPPLTTKQHKQVDAAMESAHQLLVEALEALVGKERVGEVTINVAVLVSAGEDVCSNKPEECCGGQPDCSSSPKKPVQNEYLAAQLAPFLNTLAQMSPEARSRRLGEVERNYPELAGYLMVELAGKAKHTAAHEVARQNLQDVVTSLHDLGGRMSPQDYTEAVERGDATISDYTKQQLRGADVPGFEDLLKMTPQEANEAIDKAFGPAPQAPQAQQQAQGSTGNYQSQATQASPQLRSTVEGFMQQIQETLRTRRTQSQSPNEANSPTVSQVGDETIITVTDEEQRTLREILDKAAGLG